MEDQPKEYWRSLCEQASREQDPEKLIKLIEELNKLLEQSDNFKGNENAA